MRYFYDTEFIEDGKTIDLISIGIVAEDGRELYLQSVEFDPTQASAWVKEHVLSNLVLCSHACVTLDQRSPYINDLHYHKDSGQCTFERPAKGITGLRGVQMSGFLIGAYADCYWRTREQIKNELLAFTDIEKYGMPELWAYYADYDHVAFAQLFGTMMDLPHGYPMYTKDIKQWCDALGSPMLPRQEKDEHNALADARWNRVMWDYLRTIEVVRLHNVK